MKRKIRRIKRKFENFMSDLEFVNLLMIFPSYRELKSEWEKQNVELCKQQLKITKLERKIKELEDIKIWKDITEKK